MRLRPGRRPAAYRVFFATDVHGSDRCFRKFLAAARAYHADALILGGDVAGKAMVPILTEGTAHYSFTFQGVRESVGADDLGSVAARLNFNGFYPRVVEADELARLAEDPDYVVQVFADAIVRQLDEWCHLAAERLPDDVRCIITPGNDDPFAIDPVLATASKVECPEHTVVEVGPVWLASMGDTNRTPWATDREYDEEVLADRIAAFVDPVADGRPLMFNFHCPPYNTRLDVAAKLDGDFRPVLDHGQPVEIPVGSTAVRQAIEQYRPVVGVHGHIHESQFVTRLGRCWCFNPGSDYSSGVLKGVILDLEESGGLRNHLFTSG
jgi:uncharacterized protein